MDLGECMDVHGPSPAVQRSGRPLRVYGKKRLLCLSIKIGIPWHFVVPIQAEFSKSLRQFNCCRTFQRFFFAFL